MRSAREVEPSARVNGCFSMVDAFVKRRSQRAANRRAFCSTRTVSGLRTMADCLMRPPVCRSAQASRAVLASASGVLLISASYQCLAASR